MALPPGCEPIPVDGIRAEINPRMAEVAAELNAWIQYLLQPESNDGPRIYRQRGATGSPPSDLEMAYRVPRLDDQANIYDTVSVLEDFAGDPGCFFRPAQAVCGIDTEVIEETFVKLVDGVLTWHREGAPSMPRTETTETKKDQEPWPVPDMKYMDVTDTRINWLVMRKSWVAREDLWAHEYERDFLDYQMRTENCLYAVAEHLVRYRAIMHKAGEDVVTLMEGLIRLCPRPAPADVQISADVKSIVVTGIVAAAATVLTAGAGGVTAAVLLGATAVEMAGEAVKTASAKKDLVVGNKDYLRDVVREYLKNVEQIEREVAEALTDLGDSLRRRLDQIRQVREYKSYGESPLTDKVPFFDDYRRA
ncbi:hypothetical protein [Actinophytocola sp. NPDC049390]|uniref:hypothetical protein n=1 Tax=Actinophytocola sp. NPDC049390 TaxID=3363894 RepID=UPI00378AC2BE